MVMTTVLKHFWSLSYLLQQDVFQIAVSYDILKTTCFYHETLTPFASSPFLKCSFLPHAQCTPHCTITSIFLFPSPSPFPRYKPMTKTMVLFLELYSILFGIKQTNWSYKLHERWSLGKLCKCSKKE